MNVVGGAPGFQLLPVGPGKHAPDHEHLRRQQPCGDITAERGGQGLLVLERVLVQPSGQARRGEHHLVERQDLGMVVEPGDRVAAVEPGPEVPVQGGQRRDAGRAGAHDPRGLAVVIGDPVQDQVLLGREVPEQGRLGDLGPGGDVGHRHLVEPAREEQRDRGVRNGVAGALPLQGP
jgi:hypothetical protein